MKYIALTWGRYWAYQGKLGDLLAYPLRIILFPVIFPIVTWAFWREFHNWSPDDKTLWGSWAKEKTASNEENPGLRHFYP